MSGKSSFWQLGMAGVDHRLCHGHVSNLFAKRIIRARNTHTSLVDIPAPWGSQQGQKTQVYELLCFAAKVLKYSPVLGSWYFDWFCCHILRDKSQITWHQPSSILLNRKKPLVAAKCSMTNCINRFVSPS